MFAIQPTLCDDIEDVGKAAHKPLPMWLLTYEFENVVDLAGHLLVQLSLLTFIHN